MIWILFIFILLLPFGCYVVYKETKHHELHKMRAAFEDKRHDIEKIIKLAQKSQDKEEEEIFKGELLGFEKAIEMLDVEDADDEVVDEIKKDIEELKEKIEKLFEKS